MIRAALIAMLALCAAPAHAAFDATMQAPAEQRAHQRMASLTPSSNPFGYTRKPQRHRTVRTLESRRIHGERNGMVTIKVATGGQITVAPSFAPKIAAFIAELCGVRGYCPARINCYDYAGHVPNSQHYRGTGCDFEQTGWNKTDKPMYHLGGLAAKHGLRDGCSFRDCGHIDAGGHNKRKHHSNRRHRHR